MADQHYEVDESVKPARDLMDTQRALAAAWDRFSRLHGVLIQSRDVGQSGNDLFATIAVRYGYAGDDAEGKKATAAASFGEIDSAFNAADAAVNQMLNRHL